MVRGSEKIMETICHHLGVHDGETTKDGLFTVQEVECLGACTNAPMIQVNNEWFYEDLTPENTIELLENMKKGSGFYPGPQIKERKNSEGPQGRTTLKDLKDVNFFFERDFGEAKKKWEEAREAAK